nr:hypothetical protein [Tanacetum cinerariifolium]
KCFLTAKGRACDKGVKEKHNLVLDDSGTASNKVREGIGSSSVVVSNEEPKSKDYLGGKHNVEISFATLLKGDMSQKSVSFRTLVTLFSSKDEMESMLGNGPWLIRNVSLILRKWTPDANIMMEASYARAMVELRANVELKNTIVVVVPKFFMFMDDDGMSTNKIDYALINLDSDGHVEVAYDETAQFMTIGGANDATLYEDEYYDIYDTYNIKGLTKQELG